MISFFSLLDGIPQYRMSEPPPPPTLPRYRHVETHEHIEDDPLVSLALTIGENDATQARGRGLVLNYFETDVLKPIEHIFLFVH